ncbi:MFS transporter [Elongatibacter sediminis]|uniref:MFS transporter n=1 Tax=Elongatibacter sediminis TaxID=3119006 RepID=A0AAW9R8W5_9GAMM
MTALSQDDKQLYAKVFWRTVPFLFLCYVLAFLDRVNVGFAKLQMAEQLQFSDAVFGLGAGIFFLGYFIFEVPSNIILERVGARIWIARIMITWGIISACTMFVESAWGFYLLRFLLGVAEAGFFPGIILYLTYWFPAANRARMTGLFLTAVAISNVIGAPLSGAIMQYLDGSNGWAGWQWLFLVEGIPSALVGLLVLAFLANGPRDARWLTDSERTRIQQILEADALTRQGPDGRHRLRDAFIDRRIWLLSFIYFCIIVGFYAINFWMPTLISEIGIDPRDYFLVGLLSMIPWGGAVIAMVLWGIHSDRTQERRWHTTIALATATTGLTGLAFAGHDPYLSIICLTLVTSGLLSGITVFWSLPVQFLSGTAAAAGIAWINSVGNLGGYVGPVLMGRIRMVSEDGMLVFSVLATVVALGAISVPLLRQRATPSAVVTESQP